MLRPLRLALILALTVLFAASARPARSAADGAARFGLQPIVYDAAVPGSNAYFIFDAQAGTTVTSAVRVVNSGGARGTVRLYGVDAATGQTSGTVFLTREAPQHGAGTWLTLDSTELTLDAGEGRVVPFQVAVPADATPGQHVAGLVAEDTVLREDTSAGTAPNAAGFRVHIKNLTILAVQTSLPGPVTERVTVSGVSAGGSGGYQMLVLGLGNEGNRMVKPTGTLAVTDAQGQEVQRLPLRLDTFLPATAIQYPIAVRQQALGAGRYHAKIDLAYGTSGTTTYEGDFAITAAEVAQVFPTVAPLAPPPLVAIGAWTTLAQWPLFTGGAVLLGLVLAGGIFLGRRGRAGG